MTNKRMTREAWLKAMTEHLEARFNSAGYKVHKDIRVSCGLPSTRAFGPQAKAIGQCWAKTVSADQTNEIFISPTIDDSTIVAATLAHEIAHAVVGVEHGHKKPFRDCAIAIGLEGKMTATTPSEDLVSFIDEKIIDLGEYPHARIDYTKRKKQSTRLLKVVCNNPSCDFEAMEGKKYSVRMSLSVFEIARPICGCCQTEMMIG